MKERFNGFTAARRPAHPLRKNESGVSAVIGVILMVAITVILAAVIAAFLFGMTPSLISTQGASPFGFKQDTANHIITITNNGGLVFDEPWLKVNGYEWDADTILALLGANPEGYATVPTDKVTVGAPLESVGNSVKLITNGSSPIEPGMTITVSGLVNGNRVVVATYTVQ